MECEQVYTPLDMTSDLTERVLNTINDIVHIRTMSLSINNGNIVNATNDKFGVCCASTVIMGTAG